MLTEFIINSFIVLVVVLDPIGVAPVFAALTQDNTPAYRKQMAIRGTILSAVILVTFAFLGNFLLSALGITLDAFKIAGGLFLLLLSIDMVFARHTGLRGTTRQENREAEHKEDISVFPLAIPLIAGPGGITTMMLLMGATQHNTMWVGALMLVLFLVLLLILTTLLSASWIIKFMGKTGSNVVSRLLGILLAALAIQYIIDGIRQGVILASP
ncbi:MAG: MarC family protein [Gammaproteobacteria bacterium]|nr:MarC family protein [Gammaproteobacteria bacterium]